MKIIILMCLFLSACVSNKTTYRTPSSDSPENALPESQLWASQLLISSAIDLTSQNITLSPSSGGTSVYVVMKRLDGSPIGALIPQNSATILSGEILAYNLARAFEVSSIYQPGYFHFLTGENLKVFKQHVENMKTPGKAKSDNKIAVLKDIQKNPSGIKTVFKYFGKKPQDYPGIENIETNSLNGQHIFKGSSQKVGELLKCNGPQPNPSLTISVNGGTTSEYVAVKQLSAILLIDALTQQWDRFSGGNLQTVTENGVVKFVSFDNGGTWGGEKYTLKALSYVTRFDKKVADHILHLNEALNHPGSGAHFYGLKTNEDILKALGVDQFPGALPLLKKSVAQVAQHINTNKNCYFNE